MHRQAIKPARASITQRTAAHPPAGLVARAGDLRITHDARANQLLTTLGTGMLAHARFYIPRT